MIAWAMETKFFFYHNKCLKHCLINVKFVERYNVENYLLTQDKIFVSTMNDKQKINLATQPSTHFGKFYLLLKRKKMISFFNEIH